MKRLLWARVLRSMFSPKVRTVTLGAKRPQTPGRRSRDYRPALEPLETRLAPATFSWTGNGGAANQKWSAGVNWAGGVAPAASANPIDDLVFPASAANRTAVNDLVVAGGAAAFRSLTIAGSGYTIKPQDPAANGIRLGDPTLPTGTSIIVNGGAANNTISLNVQFAGVAGSRQFITVGFSGDVTISGKLSGNTGVELTKGGVGTLTLTGDNSAFTGPITLDNNGGVVVIGNRLALGTTSQPTRVGTNATLKVSNVTGPIAEPLILNGPGIDNLGALQNLAGNNVWSGTILLDSNATVGGDAGSLELSGVISDSGAGHSLTKEGLGNIILSAANTYRGRTDINNGLLTIRNGGALGAANPATDPTGALSGTFVNQTITEVGTLAIEDVTGSGILVLDEVLTISGQGFNNQGALNNLLGFNQWAGTVFVGDLQPQFSNTAWIGSQNVNGVQQELLISGKIEDKPGQTNIFSLQKVGPGKLIFNNKNDYTGQTIVREGTLNIRDSGALGPTSGGATTVRDRATLELEVDTGFDPHGRPLGADSVTGVQNKLDVTKQLILNGVGVLNTGALRSKSGINRVLSQVQLGVQASVSAIGVDPDPNPQSGDNYFTDEYSLSLAGGLADSAAGNPTDLEKVLTGQLILPTANLGYHGVTDISAGWITAMNSGSLGGYLTAGGTEPGFPLGQGPTALGQTVQPYVKVEDGAALHLRTASPTGSISIPQNIILAGNGITHPFALISGKGALMNLQGNNTLTGDVHLSGQAGIGVERTNVSSPTSVSELTLTGSMDDTTSFQIDPDRAARIGTTGEENSQIINTGAVSGSLTVTYDFRDAVFPFGSINDVLSVYSPPRAFGGTRIFTTGSVPGPGVFTVPYTTPAAGQPGSGLVEIVVNEGGGASPAQGNSWFYQATVTPTLTVPQGGINKFGSKRLIIQGNGTYTGAVDVEEGVLRIQNDTALGSSAAGTTVEAGAALEISGAVATNNGGLAAGIQVWNEQVTLSGPGNSTNGALIYPLTVLDKDNMWRGPVSLMTSVTVDVKANSRVNILRTIDDANAFVGAGLTKVGAGELALAGTNTYRGITFVNEGVVTVENGSALGASGPDTGDVEVMASATLQLQGDITVAGKSLKIIGSGIGALPSLPIRWFSTGPAAVTNGETPGNNTVSGGRVTSVAVDPSDPNTIYLTAGTGGAWKSKDNGRTWVPLVDRVLDANGNPLSLQSMYMSYVAVAPQDPRIVYVGTGEMRSTTRPNLGASDQDGGIGILKTTDGGKSWSLLQGKTNEFVGKAITKIVVDPGTTFRGVASQNIIYVTVANAAVAPPGTPAGNNGLWRYNGTGNNWTILTNAADNPSPFRLSQNPPEVRPGPDDDLAQHFDDVDDYTDVVVAINRGAQTQRVIAFAIGSPDGGLAQVTGTTVKFSNGIFVSVFSGDTVDFQNFKWRLAGFVTTQSIDDGFGAVTYPVPGVIKLGISSVNPGLKANLDPGDYRLYASVAWPENGNNTTYSDAGLPVPFPFTPRPNGNNQGREGILRSVQILQINWDRNNGRYNVGGWANTGAQPPSYLSVAKDSPHGTFEVGYGNYAQALIVQPGQTNPEQGDAARDVVFLGGMGFPYAEGVLMSTNGGGAWTDITTGADGKGPGAFIHNFGYDTGLLGGTPRVVVATDTGVFRLDNSTPGSIQWVGLNGNLALGQMNGLDISPTSVDIAYGGLQNNGAVLFGGATGAWRQTDTGSGGQIYVDPKNPNILYHVKSIPVGPGIASSGSMLRKSTDGGQTWTDILRLDSGTAQWSPLLFDTGGNARPTINTEVKYEANSPFLVDPINTQRLLVGVRSEVASAGGNPVGVALRESVNGGNSFTNLRVPTTQPGGLNLLSLNAVAAASYQGTFAPDPGFPMVTDKGANTYDPDTIYVLAVYVDGAGAKSYRLGVTKNHGVTWQMRPFAVGATNLGQVQDIFVNPTNRDEVYAVRNVGSGQQILKSTDAGRSWDDSLTGNLPANLPVWTILLDPRNGDLYIGTDQGVYKHTKVGAASTWAPFGEGMPNVQVRHLKLNQALNTLTAGSYGRGMFQMFLSDYSVNGGVLRAVSGSAVWTGPVQLTGDTTIGAGGTQTLQGGRSTAQLTILGPISDADGLVIPPTLVKTGPGDVILGGTNTYAGDTIVQQGVLVVTNPHALGSPSAPTIVNNSIFPDTALELQSDLLDEPLTLQGNGIAFNGHNTGVLRSTSNFNTYTGVATLLGDVTIGVDSASSLTIAGNGKLVDQGGLTQVTKELTGLLVFQTANDYGGETNVNQGILNVQDPMALGRTSRGTFVLDGAQLQIERNAVSMADTVITGESLEISGTGIADTGALYNTVGNNVWRGPVTLSREPNFSPPTTPPTEVGIGVERGSDELIIDGAVGDLNDPLDPVGLRKVRSGRLTLTSADTYAGLTDIVAGALRIQNGAGLGTTDAGTLVETGAQLQLDNNISTPAELLRLNGGGIGGTGALRNVGGSNVFNGDVILETNASVGSDANTQVEVTGVISDPAVVTATAASLTKVGTGTVIFSGDNTYGGDTSVAAGILNIRDDTGLGLDAGEVQEITLFGSAGTFRVKFTYKGVMGQTAALNLLSPTLTTDLQNALNALTSIGGVGGSVTVTRNGGIFRVTFGGSFLGQNLDPMEVTGTGGTFGTVATIRDGTGATTVQPGATLQLEGGITVSTETLTLNGQGFDPDGTSGPLPALGALDNSGGANVWSRPILLASDVFLGSHAGTLSINQPIGDGGSNFGVTKVGGATLDYQAANTYTGLTQVNDGTLLLDNAGGPSLAGNLTVGDGSGADDSAVARWLFSNQMPSTAAASVGSDGLLDLNGNDQTVASLTVTDGDVTTGTPSDGQLTAGSLTMTGGTINVATTGGAVLLAGNVTATSSAAETATIQGPGQVSLDGATRTFSVADGPQATDLLISSVISGTGAEGLSKNGSGRLELDAANTYSGDTTVLAGDVQVDGSVANVKLAGGTLSGVGHVGTVTGTTGGAVGSVSPGDNGTPNPIGILTSAGQLWGPSTHFVVNLDDADTNPATPPVPGVEHDQLVVNGNLDLGGATLDGFLTDRVRFGDRYVIIRSVGGTIAGRFAEPQGAGIVHIQGQKFSVDYSDPTQVVLQRIQTDVVVTPSSSVNPSVYGQPVVFTAAVHTQIGGLPVTASATVTFTIDAGTANEISKTKFIDATGTVTFDPTEVFPNVPLSVGNHTVTMRFNGNAEFAAASVTLPMGQTVNQNTTTTDVSVTSSPVFGQQVTLTATVTPGTAVVPSATLPGGTASFRVTNLDTHTTRVFTGTVTNGVATVTRTDLVVNHYSVSVVYLGDTNYTGSTSGDVAFVVGKATTGVALAASPPSTNLGEVATFTVTVTAVGPGSGTPTGAVTFWDGAAGTGINLGTRVLAGGTASLSTRGLGVGLHDITAVYAGDANFTGATGTFTGYQVVGAATTTRLAATPAAPIVGQGVTVTATVTRNLGAGIPTGSILFTFPGGTQTVALNAQGKAAVTITGLPVGTSSVTADFVGTGDYANNGSAQAQINVTVSQASTTTTVSGVLSPTAVGQVATFTAAVRGVAPSTGTPNTGQVTFVIDGVAQAPVDVDAKGQATIDWTFTTLGVHAVQARYLGSTDYKASPLSVAFSHRVVQFATTVALVKSPDTTVYGQAVGVTATVTSVGGPAPTGSVQFFLDGVAMGAAVGVNSAGRATAFFRAIPAGDHVLTARYSGNAVQAASKADIAHTVGKANTVTALSVTPRPSLQGQTITILAQVGAVAPGGFVPVGTVTFVIDGVAQSPLAVNANGMAAITRNNLPVGSHTIQAMFTGNANYFDSQSASLTQIVNPPPPPNHLVAGVAPNPVRVLTPFTLTVLAKDVFNNVSTNYNAPVSVRLISAPAGGTLTGTLDRTFANGVATFTNLLVNVGGRYRVRIFSGGLVADLEFVTIGRQT